MRIIHQSKSVPLFLLQILHYSHEKIWWQNLKSIFYASAWKRDILLVLVFIIHRNLTKKINNQFLSLYLWLAWFPDEEEEVEVLLEDQKSEEPQGEATVRKRHTAPISTPATEESWVGVLMSSSCDSLLLVDLPSHSWNTSYIHTLYTWPLFYSKAALNNLLRLIYYSYWFLIINILKSLSVLFEKTWI